MSVDQKHWEYWNNTYKKFILELSGLLVEQGEKKNSNNGFGFLVALYSINLSSFSFDWKTVFTLEIKISLTLRF